MSAHFGAPSISRRSFLKGAALSAATIAGGSLAAACGTTKAKASNAGSDAPKYTWRTGTVVSTADPFYTYLMTMAASIREKTNGAVKLDVFPNGQLGAETDTFKLLQSGAIQFNAISTVTVNATVPSTILYSLPYVLDPSNPAKMRSAYTGTTSTKQKDDLAKIGVEVLNFVNNGTRHIGGKKFFQTPTDMHGVKIRVPGTPLYESVFKSFGAVPTPLALTDTYSALQQGLVSAYEQPLPGIQAEKWYESANHVTLAAYSITPVFIGVNKNLWASLPKNIQTGVQEAVESASSTFDSKTLPDHEKAAMTSLKGLGVSFTTPDLASWKQSASAVYSQFADQVGGMDLIDKVRSA